MLNRIGLVLLLVLVVGATVFFYTKESGTNTELSSPESIVGQTFIVGIPGSNLDADTKKFLTEIKPGGIVLYKQNIESDGQLTQLISELQKVALTTTSREYLIMIDEEPGGASRLNLFQNIFATGQPDWPTIQNDIKTMSRIGINVDLAPIADFPFDNNSFILRRTPAHTVNDLVDFNKKFISLLQDNGLGATLKHFPGMGVFVGDPHTDITYSNAAISIMNRSIDIFKTGIEDGASFIMTDHGVYDELDPNTPATLSAKIVGLLRQELDFRGIIVTDDLSDMPFIINKNVSIPEATLKAMQVGHTMVLFSRKKQTTLDAWKYVVKQYRDVPEAKQMIDSNYQLVTKYKKQHSLSM